MGRSGGWKEIVEQKRKRGEGMKMWEECAERSYSRGGRKV